MIAQGLILMHAAEVPLGTQLIHYSPLLMLYINMANAPKLSSKSTPVFMISIGHNLFSSMPQVAHLRAGVL